MVESPIFIVGCPRSGTALLRDMLSSHPRLAFPGESHFIPRLYQAYGDPSNDKDAKTLAARILSLKWIRNWDLPLNASDFTSYRSYREIVTRIFDQWALKLNKPRWGDKTPQNVAEIPTLLEIFPNSQIIHIYRDGRDVALSLVRVGFGPMNIYEAATTWKYLVNKGRRAGKNLSTNTYLEISYEGLLANPRETMKQICLFLGESFFDDVLKPTVRPGNPPQKVFGTQAPNRLPLMELDSNNCDKWKFEMNENSRLLFESVAGVLLNELGYETSSQRRKISIMERWIWKLHHLGILFIRRLNRRDTIKWLYTFGVLHFASLIRSARFSRP